jgi:hypothetical protein
MSDSGGGKGGGFGGMPEWPADAKELPNSEPPPPPRSQLAWILGCGALGAALSLLRTAAGGGLPYMVGAAVGGFILFGLIGLVLEYAMFSRAERRRRFDR